MIYLILIRILKYDIHILDMYISKTVYLFSSIRLNFCLPLFRVVVYFGCSLC